MNTHKFNLTTGIECEVSEILTRHQEKLSSSTKDSKYLDKILDVLMDITVRIGSIIIDKKSEDHRNMVYNLLASDKKKILVEARNFSMDFDPFVFEYKYKDKNLIEQKVRLEFKIDEQTFVTKSTNTVDEHGNIVPAVYHELSEVVKDFETILPKTGERVRITLLDGKGEEIAATFKKDSINSSTPIILRRPVKFSMGSTEAVPVKLNISNLPMKDTEHLRKFINDLEGDVDTIVEFERPEDDATGDSAMIQLDVVSTSAFFFPSGAI